MFPDSSLHQEVMQNSWRIFGSLCFLGGDEGIDINAYNQSKSLLSREFLVFSLASASSPSAYSNSQFYTLHNHDDASEWSRLCVYRVCGSFSLFFCLTQLEYLPSPEPSQKKWVSPQAPMTSSSPSPWTSARKNSSTRSCQCLTRPSQASVVSLWITGQTLTLQPITRLGRPRVCRWRIFCYCHFL